MARIVYAPALLVALPLLTGAAAVYAIRALNTEGVTVRSLQEYHADALSHKALTQKS